MVWSPHMLKDTRKIERMQRIAIKMVPEIKDLSYEDRLKEMELLTLKDTWERGDLIMVYKLVNNTEKIDRRDLSIYISIYI